MICHPLAAIQFDTDTVDELLATAASQASEVGLNVRGVLQSRGPSSGECHCADMDLTTISSERMFRISQPLGNGSRGCRLHPGALAECAAFLETELHTGADLLVLNRFGRGEAEGRGFRDLICTALMLDVPVLTAVRAPYDEDWAVFSADMGCRLSQDLDDVLRWVSHITGFQDAAE